MVVLVSCKNEEDPIKNEGDRVATSLLCQFSRRSRAGNSTVLDGIRPSFELIQDLWLSSLPARMKKIQSKMKSLELPQHFSQYKSNHIFSRRSRADNSVVSGAIWRKFKLIQSSMHFLVTCKMKKFQTKMKLLELPKSSVSHYKSMGSFQDFQRQVTPQYLI